MHILHAVKGNLYLSFFSFCLVISIVLLVYNYWIPLLLTGISCYSCNSRLDDLDWNLVMLHSNIDYCVSNSATPTATEYHKCPTPVGIIQCIS